MFEDIHILFLLTRYKLGLLTKLDLIIGFREYIVSKGQVFIKLIQLLLINQYKWGDAFTINEYDELNKILDQVDHNIPDTDFEVGCGSVAYVSYKTINKNRVIKKLIPNIKEDIYTSFERFKNMLKIASLLNYDIIEVSTLNNYYDFIIDQTKLDNEALMQIKVYNIYKNYEYINIPYVYAYNSEMIEMDYVKGEKLSCFLKKYINLKKECFELLKEALYIMINNNIIHSDLHEGNLLFYTNDQKVYLNIIDFGLVVHLDDKSKSIFRNYLFGNPNYFRYIIDFYYQLIDDSISYLEFTQLCSTNQNIFEKSDVFTVINFFKNNNIQINLRYLNLLLSLSSLRLKFAKDKKGM